MTESRIITGFAIFFGVGIVLHIIPALSIIPEFITDVFLFTANAIVLYQLIRSNSKNSLLAFVLLAWIFTYLAELTGVMTGRVFGEYHYGDTMKLQLMNVPLIIPFNWVILVLGMTSLVQKLRLADWAVALLAGVGLVLFDFTMEPVAVALDYWTWHAGDIPLQNYLAWFVLAAIISYAALRLKFELGIRLLGFYVLIQWIFFLCLNVFFRLQAA